MTLGYYQPAMLKFQQGCEKSIKVSLTILSAIGAPRLTLYARAYQRRRRPDRHRETEERSEVLHRTHAREVQSRNIALEMIVESGESILRVERIEDVAVREEGNFSYVDLVPRCKNDVIDASASLRC